MGIHNNVNFIINVKSLVETLQRETVVIADYGDDSYELVYCNTAASKFLGYSEDDSIEDFGDNLFQFVYPADIARVQEAFKAAPFDHYSADTYRLVNKDGQAIWSLGHHQRFVVDGQECIFITFTNVHEIIGAQLKLASDNDKWLDILNTIPVGLAIYSIAGGVTTTIAVNDMLVAFSNVVGRQLDGDHRDWSSSELMMIFNQDIYAFCTKEDKHFVTEMLEGSLTQPITECTFRLRGSTDTRTVHIRSYCCSKEVDEGRRNYYVTFQNATRDILQEQALIRNQEKLIRLSYHDTLTGLQNRNAYNRYIAQCRRERIWNVGIAFCDLNGLKQANDELGHLYGDKLIVKFSELLEKYFESSSLFRISGDEFVIVQPEVDHQSFKHLMTGLIAEVSENHNLASIGYIWRESLTDLKVRVNQAEELMYIEKQRYYEATKTITSKHRPLLLNTLLDELLNNRYVMYLQPKAYIDSTTPIGAEALVRKVDASGKIIPPYEFIPLFERERLIPKIDFLMLEETCKFLEEQTEKGNDKFKVSVNMSRVTMAENNFLDTVREICGRYNFAPGTLELEITESNQTMDNNRLSDYVLQLRKEGIGVSLDDVGSAYSSLNLFVMEGIDTVKLDRSFMLQLDTPKMFTLVKYVINLAHELGMTVIAEGVETDEHRQKLADLGCDMYQSYLLSAPVPKDEFIARWLS